MNKTELAQDVATRLGTDNKQGLAAVEAVLAAIGENVAKGEKLTLPGFGIFERADREARTARNPSTGLPIEVAATKVLKFKIAAALKAAVAAG